MLYLTRKIGDSVVINDNIEVTVVEVRGRSVKLGFTFPKDATVLRKEIYEKILRNSPNTAQVREALEDSSSEPSKRAIGSAERGG
tara:strand:- start:1225 stop:1479 length:255 start_codon:yes stop_codon:yes gene_type:complete